MTTSLSPPVTEAPPRVPLRLQLSESAGHDPLDGSWWPQSRDLDVELADLVDHFPKSRGEVYRAVVSRPDWDDAPHVVRVARGRLKVGSYPREDNHQVWLSMSNRELIRLSVRAATDDETA